MSETHDPKDVDHVKRRKNHPQLIFSYPRNGGVDHNFPSQLVRRSRPTGALSMIGPDILNFNLSRCTFQELLLEVPFFKATLTTTLRCARLCVAMGKVETGRWVIQQLHHPQGRYPAIILQLLHSHSHQEATDTLNIIVIICYYFIILLLLQITKYSLHLPSGNLT